MIRPARRRRGLPALLMLALLAFAAPLSLVPAAAPAQTAEALVPDYEAWVAVAERAEEVIAAGRASDEAFEELRADLVAWRERFTAAQQINAARIATVESQIAALGPKPEEGTSEDEAIATRRAELEALLAELRAPALRAVEAHRRAEGLIREIDRIIRDRQAEAFLRREPSPLNPANWAEPVARLGESLAGIRSETATNWDRAGSQAGLRDDLPLVIALLVVAAVLLLRGRSWMERLSALTFDRMGGGVADLFVSLGQVIVPTLGTLLLVQAAEATNLLGLRGEAIVGALPWLTLGFFGALWIAGRLFPSRGFR